MQEHINYC